MNNLNSKSELFEGKQTFDYRTHHRMPKVKITNRKRRRPAYKGIVNQEPVKMSPEEGLFDCNTGQNGR